MTQTINIKHLLLNEGFGLYDIRRHGCYTDYEVISPKGVGFIIERIKYRNEETKFALTSEEPMKVTKGKFCYETNHEGAYKYCVTEDGEYNTRLIFGELKEILELNK